MLRNWREPAMSALLIYHGLSRPGIHVTFAKNPHPQKRKREPRISFSSRKAFSGNMASVESSIVSKCFQHFVSVLKEVDQSKMKVI